MLSTASLFDFFMFIKAAEVVAAANNFSILQKVSSVLEISSTTSIAVKTSKC